MKAAITLILVSILFSAKAFADDSNLKTLVFGQSIQSREAHASEYDKAIEISTHSEVRFEIAPRPEVRAGQIQLSGYLINSGVSRQTVYLAGQNSTLLLQPQESAQIKVLTQGRPPAPPPMFVLDLPARTRVHLTGALELSSLQYSGAPDMKIKWVFQFWTTPRPSGELIFKLPTQDEAKLPALKIEIQKFNAATEVTSDAGPIAKITASLRNVSNDLQLFCKSSQAGFGWDLRDAEGHALPNRDETVVTAVASPLTESDCSIIAPGKAIDLETATLASSKSGFEFQSNHLTFTKLSRGAYQIYAQVLNRAAEAAGADAQLIKKLSEMSHAPPAAPTIETTTPLTIP